ncbi:Serine/threonine-protein kinase ppk1-like 1 [Homarus americanus]|uniref:Serine/threonine-protein kinase ppk1-like 1 n=1 Tax=Homarus americanus TaxID=6706 RepID=A0A8J5JZS3_HOMAM|nr:Serine/threonine-protein kinase ppk1-like 1 [Homarus americanus]
MTSLVQVTPVSHNSSSSTTSTNSHYSSSSTTSTSSHNSSSSTNSSSGGRDLPQLTWDRLHLVGNVGTGEFGVSHHGQLTLSNGDVTDVVVKILHSGKANTKEARILHELAVAGGTPILYGVTTKPHAIVMQYCRGVLLSSILNSFMYDVHHRQEAYDATCVAVAEFHGAGYSHVDLHAGNIIIDTSTSPYTCHLIDVGLSERIPPDDDWWEKIDWRDLQDIQTRLHLNSPDDIGRRELL